MNKIIYIIVVLMLSGLCEVLATNLHLTGVARSSDGTILTNQYASIKVLITPHDDDENTIFEEKHTVHLNKFGIYSCTIGSGSQISGSTADIDVDTDKYIIHIGIDASAPFSTYTLLEIRDFHSVVEENTGGNVSTLPEGTLRAFSSLEDRDGWTYTGVSECKGTPDTWTAMSTIGAPSARNNPSCAWTGEYWLMFAGGFESSLYNDLYKYTPETDTWEKLSSTNAPSGRIYAVAEWTGDEFIVFGGYDNSVALSGGGAYNPETNSWRTLSTTNAPSGRYNHMSVWTGDKMIVWGGTTGGTNRLNSGAVYDPASDTWTTMTTTSAPDARVNHTAVWTGEDMIIWGGTKYSGASVYLNDGHKYDPENDTWTAISTTSAPSIRENHNAVWTGSKMLIWGGRVNSTTSIQNGGVYDPNSDTWSSMSTTNAATGTCWLQCAWSGEEMIVWGGAYYSGSWTRTNSGAAYNPEANSWRALSTTNALSARSVVYTYRSFWTGEEMLIWGGWSGVDSYDDGVRLGGAQSIYWYRKTAPTSDFEPSGGGG